MNDNIIKFGTIFILSLIIIYCVISSWEMGQQANKICQEKGFYGASKIDYNFFDGLIFKFNPTKIICEGTINDCIIGCETK